MTLSLEHHPTRRAIPLFQNKIVLMKKQYMIIEKGFTIGNGNTVYTSIKIWHIWYKSMMGLYDFFFFYWPMEIYNFYLGNHLCSVLSSIFDFFFPLHHLYWNSTVHQENVYFVLLRTRYLRSPQSSKETDQTQNYIFKILCDQIYHLCMQRPWDWQSGMEGCVCLPWGRRRRRHVEEKSYRQRIWATSWKWDGRTPCWGGCVCSSLHLTF